MRKLHLQCHIVVAAAAAVCYSPVNHIEDKSCIQLSCQSKSHVMTLRSTFMIILKNISFSAVTPVWFCYYTINLGPLADHYISKNVNHQAPTTKFQLLKQQLQHNLDLWSAIFTVFIPEMAFHFFFFHLFINYYIIYYIYNL